MAQKTHFYVKNIGPDREYRHYQLAQVPGKFVLIAPGVIAKVTNATIHWPSGAIIVVPREVWSLSPALGRYQWNQEVSHEDFEAQLIASCQLPCPECPGKDEQIAVLEAELLKRMPMEELTDEKPVKASRKVK